VAPASSGPGKTSLLAVILVAAAAYGAGAASIWFYFANPTISGKKPAGRPADMSGEKIVALGRIRPAGGIRSVTGPPGDQIAELLVKEGDQVRAETPLVRLVSRLDRQDEMDLLDQQIADAQAQVKLAKASGDREIAVSKAKLDEQMLLAPRDVEAMEKKLNLLEQQQKSAEKRLLSMKALQHDSPNTISSQDVDGQELLVAQANTELEAGKAQLTKAKLAQETGQKVAEAQLEAAKANLERSLREIPLDTLKKKRELAQLQFNRTELKAPAAGRVVKITGRVGDPTAPQQSIMDLADTAVMQVVAEVYETDVDKLRKMHEPKVTVRSLALPNDLTGTVTSIGTVIARNAVFDVDPTADTDRRVFEVVVTIDKPEDVKTASQFLNLQVQAFFDAK
jgi:HlyD family secretion protein